jgi:iron complex outermembrane receptor protein
MSSPFFTFAENPVRRVAPGPRLGLLLACSGWLAAIAAPADPAASVTVLKQMTLDQLLNVDVTSVSKTAEPYRETAAALTVITGEQIRRSGATTIPEVLRGVPGLHVARQSANDWAISSRGFSSVNSEKLLVQSDTRSIYTPLFSGVQWDVQDYLLADIERIEVIRGPGAALWGSNAVNGVINITTKDAADTQGTHLEVSSGTDLPVKVAARHGTRTAGGVHYRVFGQYSEYDETRRVAGTADDWRMAHAGFRADWAGGADDTFTLQGDVYRGNIGNLAPAVTIIGRPGPTGNLEAQVTGGNILGRWRHQHAGGAETQLRAYYDHTRRVDPSFVDELDTVDLDLQHSLAPHGRHQVMWGLNYRHASNRNEGKGVFAVQPPSSDDRLASAFVQDQMVWSDALRTTVGTKLEHNDFSGFEIQPSVRAAWDLSPRHTLWAAVSRAARIPTRLERDVFIDVTDPAGDPVVRLLGNRDFAAEEMMAYELGWRWRAAESLHVDVAVFDNHYDGLSSLEIGDPFTDPTDGRTVIPIVNRNLTKGRATGFEALVTFTPLENWRLSASYTHLDLTMKPAGQDLNRGAFYEGATPRDQIALTSQLDLPGGIELDAQFRSLSAIRRLPEIVSGEGLPGYSELNVRVAWRVSAPLRVSVVGQNLLHGEHVEFGPPSSRGPVRRGVYAKLEWDF